MLRTLGWTIVAAIFVAAAWYLHLLTGTVTVGAAGYSVTLATSLAIVAFAILLALVWAVIALLAWVLGTPLRFGRWRARKRRGGGDTAITRTLLALAAGEEGSATREARRARKLLGDTPQTLLLAAEAERLAGNEAAATELYQTLAKRQDGRFLGLRGLYRQAIARQEWDTASQIARQAEALRPGGAWLRGERAQLAVRTQNWREALALSGPDAPRVAYGAAAADASTDPKEALRLAQQAWNADPGFAPAALAYAKRLRDAGKESRAQEVVRRAWRTTPIPELAEFALAKAGDGAQRVREATRLAQLRPNDPEGMLLMARAALGARMFAEARRDLESAQRAGLNQRRVWTLLAEIEKAEHGDTAAGKDAQAEALRRAASAEPDPTWHCDACGTTHAAWHPVCPVCSTPGRIRWGSTATVTPQATDILPGATGPDLLESSPRRLAAS